MAASPDVGASSLRVRLGTQYSPASSSLSPASQTHHDHRNTMKRQAPCEPSDDRRQASKRGPSSRPPRASQACRSCAASKVRCDDLEICRRCLKRGVPCVRPTQVGQGHRTAMTDVPCALSDSSTSASVDRDDSCILASTTQDLAEAASVTIAPIGPVARDEDRGDLANATYAFPNSPMSLGHSGHSQPCSDIQTMDNLGNPPLTDITEWFKNPSFHAEFDTSFLLPLPFIDLSGFSDDILVENPADLTTLSSESLLPQDKAVFNEAVIAYSTTLGSWKPTHEDYLAAARASLYVPVDEQVRLEEDLGRSNSTVIAGCLSSARRDEIIVAMIDGTQTAQSLLAVRMFPSAEILDRFLRIFLSNQETSASAFLHIPTFDPSTCSLSLLMACIAAGATLSPISSARKFGLGLFDVLRLYLAASAEKENILTRDLPYVQSLMILSETGLWSGDKRLSEISDFLSGLTATMLRHAGRLVQHSYFNPDIMLEGPSDELDGAWRRWAQQESLKRTVFRHLLQCTQRSVLKNIPAQMSPFEVSTPIPEDCLFWYAKSAVEWKSLYQGRQSAAPRIAFTDCLSDMRSIDLLPYSQSSKLSRLLMIYSFLSILVEDRRRSVLFHKKSDSGWSFTDITRPPGDSHLVFQFKELQNVIERDYATTGSAVLTFMIEFNILYSATPRYLRDSLLTYGKQDSASDIFSKLQEWRQSRSSRSAIWHAGQLIRACRMIAPKERTDFHLFGVYHAVLCLWTYWTATRKSPLDMTGTNNHQVSRPRILLDGPESLETQRWISHNNGTPYLKRPPKTDHPCDAIPELVPVDATQPEGTLSKLPLVDMLNECFLHKATGRNIPILQHASLILCSLERL